MIKTFKQIIFCTFFLSGFLVWGKAQAACGTTCTKSDTIYTCTDANYECIQTAIDGATTGDTINVTYEGSVTWPTGAITISNTKPVNLVGSGADKLTIILGGSTVISIANYIGTSELPAATISGFKFQSPLDAEYGAIVVRGQGWRIHNNTFESLESSHHTAPIMIEAGGDSSVQTYGLIDNNNFINTKVDGAGGISYAVMANAWVDDLDLGTNEAIYVENNTFTTTTGSNKTFVDSGYASKMVIRYNTMQGGTILQHGHQGEDERGSRKWEIYGNRLDFNTTSGSSSINVKSGTGVIFSNDWSGDFDVYIGLIGFTERSYK